MLSPSEIRQILHDGLTLEKLEAWLATRDPNEGYHYSELGDCLLSRYTKSLHSEFTNVSNGVVLQRVYYDTEGNSVAVDYPLELNQVAYAPMQRQTMGEALKRLKKIKKEKADESRA